MKKILLIGGRGYIGSLFNYKFKDVYNITSIDIDWYNENKINSIDYNTLEKAYIQEFDVVILLAGHSSVKMCDSDLNSSFNNNVRNFTNLLTKLNRTQKFVYASSSSVYGHTDSNIVSENYNTFIPNNYYDLSKQVIDMYVSITNLNYYGLRFGTVNGWSPNLRSDIMINAMTTSAIDNKQIKLYTKHIMRPILGTKDLCNALQAIIEKENSERGIYNLASFNSTSGEIANSVSQYTGCPVVEFEIEQLDATNNNIQKNAYNFAITSSKFENQFNFKFKDTIASITNDVIEGYNSCNKTTRNYHIQYA
jgi:UDP-glucose 4-epimerase